MNDVKVSVCMVTYNHEQTIAQAVESALAQQTTFGVEIVVGEDCSTDGTRAILEDLATRHAPRLRVRLAEQNRGGGVNFRETFADCHGQYIAMLEGDDYWTHPLKLQRQVDALDARADWALCFHPAKCLYEDGLTGSEFYPPDWSRPEATIVDLMSGNFIATASVVFRNRLFGPFPPWFAELSIGDWPLHILNAAHGNIGFLPDVMSVYRIHARGAWSGRDLASNLTTIFKMFRFVDRHFDGKYAEQIEQYQANTLQWMARDRENVPPLVMVQRIEELEAACRRLAADNLQLRSFHDAWVRSFGYRATREVLRLRDQLRVLTARLAGAPATPLDETQLPESKAA